MLKARSRIFPPLRGPVCQEAPSIAASLLSTDGGGAARLPPRDLKWPTRARRTHAARALTTQRRKGHPCETHASSSSRSRSAPPIRHRGPVPALADDPLLRRLEREDGRQGPGHGQAGRHPARQPRGRRPVDNKVAAREGLVKVANEVDFGDTQLWTRVNSLESPWVLDDLTTLVTEIGDKLDVIMVPKVEGAWDIHYVDRLLAQLEAKAGVTKPILVHAILETAQGVVNLEEIACASPRMQGMSFGPADLAASRRMKTTRVGGGHPGYLVINDPDPDDPEAPRATAQQDPWHYSIARMVDACTSAGLLPFYGPYGDIKDVKGCEAQFRAAFLLGCVGTWTLHPVQIDIAKKVFSPTPDEVLFAKKVIEAIPDGKGVHMIDGKMQDDATWKQCKVMVDLAEMLAEKDPELKEAYGF